MKTLGKLTRSLDRYDPSILDPIERVRLRSDCFGYDIWTMYELSWLNPKGKPVSMIGKMFVPIESKYIVESKSLKLYLNSLSNTQFQDTYEAKQVVKRDITGVLEHPIDLYLYDIERLELDQRKGFDLIDALDVECEPHTGIHREYLSTHQNKVADCRLQSNLLRTNCPVTNQPDWATVIVSYTGQEIDKVGLVRYLASYRQHSGFHENCVEQIYSDIREICKPEELGIEGRFTRRGGIDINPIRSTKTIENIHRYVYTKFARQ